MKKITLLFFLSCLGVNAQVKIGDNPTSIDPSAALHVESTNKGMLLPVMTTAQITAISSPATGLLVYDANKNCLVQNVGTAVAPNWSSMSNNVMRWFYMPSIVIDTSLALSGQTKDLFALYQEQFNNPAIKSSGAPNSLPFFSAATDLYYYVTSYDTSVLANVSINASGILTYDVIAPADGCSVVNVVFLLK